jgi:hypothetical protein
MNHSNQINHKNHSSDNVLEPENGCDAVGISLLYRIPII